MECNECRCAEYTAKAVKQKAIWEAMPQAEKDAEIAKTEDMLRSVSCDPTLTIFSGGQKVCQCDCHSF